MINLGLILKAAFKNIDNTETYEAVKDYLVNLAEKNVPGRVLGLYTSFIKVYEVLKLSCKNLALRIKNTPNTLDNYCLQQGLNAIIAIAKKVQDDAEEMAKIAGITL